MTADALAFHAWSMAIAATASALCALVGTFLVVRRMSLLGDAIAHAVLPGIVIGVLAGGSLGSPLVFVGAVAASLLTVWLTQALRAGVGLAEDAGAGVVFTTLFALGVVIVSLVASKAHLDPDCILFGMLDLAAFDLVSVGPVRLPRALFTAVVLFLVVGTMLAMTWSVQVFTAFDSDAARAVGVPVGVVTTALLVATAAATVAGFEAVGFVLVVAMLVVPAAAAELVFHRMHHVAFAAVTIAVVSACLGWIAAWQLDTSAAGMIAVILGAWYGLAVVVAPGDGLLARALARIAFAWRVAREDSLARLWRACEASGAGVVTLPNPRSILERAAAAWLRFTGAIESTSDGVRLSVQAAREAETVVRSHRLWEAWLGRHADLPVDHLHPPAEWIEHHLGLALRQQIAAELARGAADPHGREIPPEAG